MIDTRRQSDSRMNAIDTLVSIASMAEEGAKEASEMNRAKPDTRESVEIGMSEYAAMSEPNPTMDGSGGGSLGGGSLGSLGSVGSVGSGGSGGSGGSLGSGPYEYADPRESEERDGGERWPGKSRLQASLQTVQTVQNPHPLPNGNRQAQFQPRARAINNTTTEHQWMEEGVAHGEKRPPPGQVSEEPRGVISMGGTFCAPRHSLNAPAGTSFWYETNLCYVCGQFVPMFSQNECCRVPAHASCVGAFYKCYVCDRPTPTMNRPPSRHSDDQTSSGMHGSPRLNAESDPVDNEMTNPGETLPSVSRHRDLGDHGGGYYDDMYEDINPAIQQARDEAAESKGCCRCCCC